MTAARYTCCACVQDTLSTLTICEDWTKSQQLSAMESYVSPEPRPSLLLMINHWLV